MIATFNRFELKMTYKQAESCTHPGPCDPDVEFLLNDPLIKRQFKKIDPALIANELKEYGAWDEEELKDVEENQRRILWIACWDIVEGK